MSTIYLVIIIFGIIATAIFVLGFARGLRDAIRDYRNKAADADDSDDGRYGQSAIFAVVASAVVIALVGFNPVFVYVGPLLAIVTALGVGVAFFLDRPVPGNARNPR